MSTLKPYADDAASLAIGDLTIENGQDSIAVGGSLDLTRDKVGLAARRAHQVSRTLRPKLLKVYCDPHLAN